MKKSGKTDKNNSTKGFNKSDTEIKIDYIQLFEKYYKIKDNILKDYLNYLKIKQNQETKNVLINKNAIPQGFANVMKDIC